LLGRIRQRHDSFSVWRKLDRRQFVNFRERITASGQHPARSDKGKRFLQKIDPRVNTAKQLRALLEELLGFVNESLIKAASMSRGLLESS